jgi:thiosulfate/3-mercaptopyruvate sulfurtransferase
MTPLELPTPLVSVRWLADHLEAPDLVLLDASMQPPGTVAPANAEDDWIRSARIFDFDKKICAPDTALPHMMPSAELFMREVRALGVNQTSRIVVYDRIGIFSSPRAWWMFKAMGHDAVAVLDGGLPAWRAAGLPTEQGPRLHVVQGDFVARPRPQLFCSADRVAAALDSEDAAVLDARSEGRFVGRDLEPRPGLRAGHMPNALNLPFGAVQASGHMRSPTELAALLSATVGDRRTLIFSCGSGVTACTLALAAELAGYSDKAVYDGSWSEWGLPSSSRPVVRGSG